MVKRFPTLLLLVSLSVLAEDRVQSGLILLYTFNEGAGSTVLDSSDAGTPIDLTFIAASVDAGWVSGGLSIEGPSLITSLGSAARLTTTCQATGELTVEAWIKPTNVTQGGQGRIFGYSEGALVNQNFVIGQDTDTLFGRTSFGAFEQIETTGLTATLMHLVLTADVSGTSRLYIDSVEKVSLSFLSGFSSWGLDAGVTVGNEVDGQRPWLGTLYLAAAYSRALTPAEVTQNYLAGTGDFPDAGPRPDAGSAIDAGTDAGVVDSGVVDSGVVDSGVVDSGIVDSGIRDAGVRDSGVADGGAGGELPIGEHLDLKIGCDCGAASGGLFLQLLWVLLAAASLRRKRSC